MSNVAITGGASVSALESLEAAKSAGLISAQAAANIQLWLTKPEYAEYAPLVLEHVASAKWAQLEDVFWTTIPFGTAGRRGRMCPIGTNAINDRTIGESAQGLAGYVKSLPLRQIADLPYLLPTNFYCAISYHTRPPSPHFPH